MHVLVTVDRAGVEEEESRSKSYRRVVREGANDPAVQARVGHWHGQWVRVTLLG